MKNSVFDLSHSVIIVISVVRSWCTEKKEKGLDFTKGETLS
jgi:hypothetical protein